MSEPVPADTARNIEGVGLAVLGKAAGLGRSNSARVPSMQVDRSRCQANRMRSLFCADAEASSSPSLRQAVPVSTSANKP